MRFKFLIPMYFSSLTRCPALLQVCSAVGDCSATSVASLAAASLCPNRCGHCGTVKQELVTIFSLVDDVLVEGMCGGPVLFQAKQPIGKVSWFDFLSK